LNDLVLPIFVEEEIDDYKAIEAMRRDAHSGKISGARDRTHRQRGIRSVMTFGISHHTDATGSDTWNEDGLSAVCRGSARDGAGDDRHVRYLLLRIHSHGHCGVLCDHGWITMRP
jgi:porphobilinogen synthase